MGRAKHRPWRKVQKRQPSLPARQIRPPATCVASQELSSAPGAERLCTAQANASALTGKTTGLHAKLSRRRRGRQRQLQSAPWSRADHRKRVQRAESVGSHQPPHPQNQRLVQARQILGLRVRRLEQVKSQPQLDMLIRAALRSQLFRRKLLLCKLRLQH